MEKIKNPIIYLAYHKTASKWMWKHFFNEFYDCQQVDVFNLNDNIITNNKTQKILRTRLEEGLMGSERFGLSKKIKELFPDARIVLTLRSQRSMLPSHYTQYVENGGRLSFKKYLREVVKNKWYYSKLLEDLYQDFGQNQVFVYLFEDFQSDKFRVLNNLKNFIEFNSNVDNKSLVPIVNLPRQNPKRNDLVVDTMMLLNRMRMRHRKNAILFDIRRSGRDHIVVEFAHYIANIYMLFLSKPLAYRKYDGGKFIDRAYHDENIKLSNMLDRDLKELNYPILS